MIVVSLLLILVAVTLLVLGLTGGSSGLLISSIVASLVAAVFLVIGARQAAAARRETPAVPEEPSAPAEENSVFVAEPEFEAGDEPARRSGDLPPRVGSFAADSGASDDQRDTVQFDPGDLAAARPSAGPEFADHDVAEAHPTAGPDFSEARSAGPDLSEARSAGPDFSEAPSAGPDFSEARSAADSSEARSAAGPDYSGSDFAAGRSSADYRSDIFADQADAAPAGDLSADEAGVAGRRDAAADDPDYDRAFAAINSARSEVPNEDAWRRESPAASGSDEPVEAEEFAEPDADDPDDEPLPQAVRPADAVGVARLEAEVMVVDGRPRYHLPECPSLVGRLAEPIPVREAVELGFSPCGLCRPVDRLVGAAARR